MGPFVSVPRFAVAWTDVQDVLLVIAAGGALFNSWRIARLSGRVDALESTMRTVQTVLAGRSSEAAQRPLSPSCHGGRLRFEDLDYPRVETVRES